MQMSSLKKVYILMIVVVEMLHIHTNLVFSQEEQLSFITVRPQLMDSVLLNPGIGFMTFQRFNGDDLNEGSRWTEGFPIEYQDFDGDLTNKNYPQTTMAYFRVNWRFVEPEKEKYNWGMIDKALDTAAQRGQTLMLRISPYEGDDTKDVPAWYREMVGEAKNLESDKWRVDPEDPRFLQYFGGMIKALGNRYDGHPDLESVDISFVGYWGEGDGTHLLSDNTRIKLIRSYLDNFKKTPLIFQPLNGDAPDPGVLVESLPIAARWPDGRDNGQGPEMRHVGWRIDCLGDMGFWDGWCHMLDVYPQDIIKSGMMDAWEKAPVTMEICGTFMSWLEREKYDEKTIKYSFDQALKWHVSSFNAKSSPVPEQWMPMVNDWLKKMGYRFALRKLTYPAEVRPHGPIFFTSWWENQGVAPCYKDFKLAFRLRNSNRTEILLTDADIRKWLPGDILYDDRVFLPDDLPEGSYDLELGIISLDDLTPKVKLAISGIRDDGWYTMGKISVRK
jgi:hypothetical protein